MGLIELAKLMGMDKGLASRLVQRGMPTSSVQAAQAWRETNAKPRAKRGGASPSPITPAPVVRILSALKADIPPAPASTPAPADDDGPSESLRRAKAAENASYKRLFEIQRDKNASMEDIRKASLVYIASRSNRQRAELDFRDHQRAEGVTMFADEAREICGRGHLAVAKMLGDIPKALAPRLVGMSQKSIEKSLGEFADKICKQLRQSF